MKYLDYLLAAPDEVVDPPVYIFLALTALYMAAQVIRAILNGWVRLW